MPSQILVPVTVTPRTYDSPETYTVPALPQGLKGIVYLGLSSSSPDASLFAGPVELEVASDGVTYTAAQCGEL